METKQNNEKYDNYLDFLKLIQSPEWSQWLAFLKDRRTYLQGRANQALREGNTMQATIYLALMDECMSQIDAFKMRGDVMKKNVERMTKDG